MFDYNVRDVKYDYTAVGDDYQYERIILSPKVFQQYTSIFHYLSKEWSKSDADKRKQLWGINGCLNKLKTCYYQTYRLSNHIHNLIDFSKKLIRSNQNLFCYPAFEAITDFESLLLQGRAALDRLTLFISSQYRQQSDRFSRLANILNNFKDRDSKASNLLALSLYSIDVQLDKSNYYLIWNNPTAVLSEYTDDLGVKFSVIESFNPDGFKIKTLKVNSKIFHKAFIP